MSATRKFAYMFDEGNPFHAATSFIDASTCKDHLAAGLNGQNGSAITALLDALISGALEPLTKDDNLRTLWVTAGFKPEHLTVGTLTVLATGRLFGFSKSQRAISTGKVGSDAALAVKAAIWDAIGNGARHYNQREAVKAAIPAAVKPVEPVEPVEPATKAKPRQRKAAKVDQVSAAA